MKAVGVALVGDSSPDVPAHQAIPAALRLSAESLGDAVEPTWTHTSTLGADVPSQLSGFGGIWCVPASPYANADGALAAIRFAREGSHPFFVATLFQPERAALKGIEHPLVTTFVEAASFYSAR